MTDLEIARKCGATSYSPPPLRAVRGLSFTFDQLTAFADRIRAQQREGDAALLREAAEALLLVRTFMPRDGAKLHDIWMRCDRSYESLRQRLQGIRG